MKTYINFRFVISLVVCSSLVSGSSIARASNSQTPEARVVSQAASSNSMWASMSNDFAMDHALERPEVQAQIAVLQKNQAALYRTLNAAAPYISYVFQQTHKAGLPGELALLPIVESQYDPMAKSQVGASGVWQIMAKTAPDLGLKNNQAYDGRRDIVASTDAALGYLKQLKNMLSNDWHLALAAYNFGPGNVRKAAKKKTQPGQKPDYWNLPLPKETKDYVPKLMALAAIIKNPAKYNVHLPVISTGPQLATVQVAANQDLKVIAKANGITIDQMRKLNPGYHKLATTSGAPNRILLPVDKTNTPQTDEPVFAANTATTPADTTAVVALNQPVLDKLAGKASSPAKVLMETILKQGKWLMLGFADMPSIMGLKAEPAVDV
ncbi:MAG TPA: transglycosylase SLT domain-containing protein [Gammaproteobacteria bacterium]|nr:transglycosylase SLT domain-containing protein [Gammaproteobacteria bacterium]